MPLKIAAHLIGFSQFPTGWQWKEWKIVDAAKENPPNLENLTFFNFVDEYKSENQNKAGKTAERLGSLFRREKVRDLLLRFLQRNEISFMIQTDNCEWLEPSFKLRNDPFLELKISRSGIKSVNLEWLTFVDAISLFDRLEKEKSWNNKDKDNWFVFERFSRKVIEQEGFDMTYENLIGRFNDWKDNLSLILGEFDDSTAKSKLGMLKKEYSKSENHSS